MGEDCPANNPLKRTVASLTRPPLTWNVRRTEMALSEIAEALLEPLVELVFHVVGYATGVLLVKVLSLGRATVEVTGSSPVRPRWHGFSRSADGHVVVDAEMATLIGIAFWSLVAVVAFIVYF